VLIDVTVICYDLISVCSVWAVDICTGNEKCGCEHNSIYSLFSIKIVLTDAGFTHLHEVCTLNNIQERVKKLVPL
jgi:hypothetical protein